MELWSSIKNLAPLWGLILSILCAGIALARKWSEASSFGIGMVFFLAVIAIPSGVDALLWVQSAQFADSCKEVIERKDLLIAGGVAAVLSGFVSIVGIVKLLVQGPARGG